MISREQLAKPDDIDARRSALTIADTSASKYGVWIDNQETAASSGEWFGSVEPATGRQWARFALGTVADVDRAVSSAARAVAAGSLWAHTSPAARRRTLLEVASVLLDYRDEIAEVETRDAGKLLKETRLHVEACAEWFEYFAGMTDKVVGETNPAGNRLLTFTLRQPYGVLGAIVPGNSPILLTTWKLAPALAAGNTVVVKPSEFTTASLLTLLRRLTGVLPPGVVNVVPGLGPEVGQRLVAHPAVRKVAFTGGTKAGAAVAAAAGNELTPTLLELGGKSANIVFADANYEKAMAGVMAGVFAASGQTCMAGARVLIERRLYGNFVEDLVARTTDIVVGHPADDATQVGPVGSIDSLHRIEEFVERARTEGAEVLAGGVRVVLPNYPNGFYYRPTILAGARPDFEVNRCEVFGPVMTVAPFDTEDEALRIANDSDFGLVAGVWTSNLNRALRLSRDLDVGTVFVNLYRKVLPQTPFGGRGKSGYGRENGMAVMHEYTQLKSCVVDLDDSHPQDPFLMRVGDEG